MQGSGNVAQPGGGALGRDSQLRRARAARIIELKLNNVPNGDVALMMGGLNEKTIRREMVWAEAQGIIDEVRKTFTDKLLTKAAKVYETALDMEATEANVAVIKVHEHKLKAARDVAIGTGVLSKEAVPKSARDAVPNLEGYIEIYKARMALRSAEVIDADILPDIAPSSSEINAADIAADNETPHVASE